MEVLIPLKDILIGPGKRFDPSTSSEDDVIALIKKTYGFLAENMEVSIHEGMVRIKFKNATPEKINEALPKLEKAVHEPNLSSPPLEVVCNGEIGGSHSKSFGFARDKIREESNHFN
jgi:hypothetical protein